MVEQEKLSSDFTKEVTSKPLYLRVFCPEYLRMVATIRSD